MSHRGHKLFADNSQCRAETEDEAEDDSRSLAGAGHLYSRSQKLSPSSQLAEHTHGGKTRDFFQQSKRFLWLAYFAVGIGILEAVATHGKIKTQILRGNPTQKPRVKKIF